MANTPKAGMLTLKQVCERLGCGWAVARLLVTSGALPAYRLKPGGNYRIRERDLEAYVESQKIVAEDGGS
jgi:excisionase family DNA binding protein